MSEPTSSSEPTPAVPPAPDAPPAPSFTYGTPSVPEAPATPPPAAAPIAPPQYGERLPGYENGPAYGAPEAPPAAAPGHPVAGAAAPGYATPGYAPGYAAPYGLPPVKRRRTWDVILTVILLVVGLFGMIIGLFYAWILSDPLLFAEAMATQGISVAVDTRGAALIIGITHPVLYLAALGVSILLLVKSKVAFWVPLAAGVIAAIVFWATIMAALLSDPSVMDSFSR